ncbi:MAG: response regulator transcription factor [Taibaiella sp.]|nr:response regulator transcription factor [Taibaiella sp.]
MRNSTPTTIRVAYADDHAMVREGLCELLTKMSARTEEKIEVCIQASTGLELLEKLEKAKELPDVCLLDIHMPGLNGFDTMVELRKRWQHLRVLAITVFENEHHLIRMIARGADGFIVKNNSGEQLLKGVLSVYNTGAYYADQATMKLAHAVKTGRIREPRLTQLEQDFLPFVCTDLTYDEIAEKMGTTRPSIDGLRVSLFRKLEVATRTALAVYGIKTGLIPLELTPAA